MKKIIILIVVIAEFLFSKEFNCSLNHEILEIIAKVEGSPKRPVGYPYLISFNKPFDYRKKLNNEKFKFIDTRTLDCIDRDNCVKIFEELTKRGVKNVDLGAFQLNYIYHKFEPYEYFTLENSYMRACNYLERLIKSYGYSWKTIARYHSSTPSHNLKYRKMISNVIARRD